MIAQPVVFDRLSMSRMSQAERSEAFGIFLSKTEGKIQELGASEKHSYLLNHLDFSKKAAIRAGFHLNREANKEKKM